MRTIVLPREVIAARRISRSSLYNDIRAELWTEPVRISARRTGWPLDEVQAQIDARCKGASPDELRALVRRLVEARRIA